jgi:type IV secretion system protein VirD4
MGQSQQSSRKAYCETERHGLVIGGTGSGKTTGSLVPWALNWPGSLIWIGDVMSEGALLTAAHRSTFSEVVLNDPYETFPDFLGTFKHGGYNPLARQNEESEYFVSNMMSIAAGCVPRDKYAKEKYWDNGALSLVQIVSMAEVLYNPTPSLGSVAEIISGDVQGYLKRLLERYKHWTIQNKGKRYVLPSSREDEVRSLREVIENTRTHMAFCLDPTIAANLDRNDYSYGDCRRKRMSIYNIIPAKLLMKNPELAKFCRLHLQCAISELFDGAGDVPVLIIADEYQQLAHEGLDIMPLALAAGRKFQVQIVLSVTSHSEFVALHKNEHEAMYDNMGFVQWLQANSLSDSRHLSELCGEREVQTTSNSVSNDPAKSRLSVNHSTSVRDKKLILPHEVRSMGRVEEIVFMDGVPGRGPLRLNRTSYRDIPELAAVAGPNPYYKEKPPKEHLHGAEAGRA